MALNKITIKGYRSIRELDTFELGPVNVLIGANGSGKSNFVSFFSLLREIVDGRLALAVNRAGGADAHLYLGPQITKQLYVNLVFGENGYGFTLEPTADNRLVFADERIKWSGRPPYDVNRSIGSGHSESKLKEQIKEGQQNKAISEHIYNTVSRWVAYHFHDTSNTAAMRRTGSIRDNERLRPDGGNLAAFLYYLREQETASFTLICDTIRLVAPYFDEFTLRPQKAKDEEIIELEWKQKGTDYPFHPGQLSDGTLRFIELATALLQPKPPQTIVIDEPELGLHPYAISVLADLIQSAAERTQVIISTQSATLLDYFEPQQIIVVNRQDGQSTFERLDPSTLSQWMEDYSVGELWQKNVVRGGPARE